MTTISTPAATHSTKKIYTVDSFEAIAGGTDWRCFRTNAQRPLGHRQGYGVTVDRGRGSRGPLAPSGGRYSYLSDRISCQCQRHQEFPLVTGSNQYKDPIAVPAAPVTLHLPPGGAS